MNMQLVQDITKKQLRNDIPDFKAGDTVKVYVKIKEGDKTRTQLFEGVCIANLVKLLELKKFVNKKYGKFPYFFSSLFWILRV